MEEVPPLTLFFTGKLYCAFEKKDAHMTGWLVIGISVAGLCFVSEFCAHAAAVVLRVRSSYRAEHSYSRFDVQSGIQARGL